MSSNLPPISSNIFPLITGQDFSSWESLNDSIMGGSSTAQCSLSERGLLLKGELVEKDGGFVSCRSPEFTKPFNLSKYKGFVLVVEGEGRTLKFAVGCQKKIFSFSEFFDSNVRWVTELPTNKNGITTLRIPFKDLQPAIRAKPVRLPIKFNSSKVTQFQLLHSKFGKPGQLNSLFKPGPISIYFHSISAYY